MRHAVSTLDTLPSLPPGYCWLKLATAVNLASASNINSTRDYLGTVFDRVVAQAQHDAVGYDGRHRR